MENELESKLTGHPFIDIGLMAIAEMADCSRLADITTDDLYKVARQLKAWYTDHNAARNYISTIFTNSHFTQPSMTLEQRQTYADRYLFAFTRDHLAEDGERRCTYFPQYAAVERAYRQHIPLLNGENIGNFSGMGQDGLPVSGLALLAIHALPFGCLKCGGRLLGFHQLSPFSDSPDAERMMRTLVRLNYRKNMDAMNLLPGSEKHKFPDFGGKARTRYVTALIEAYGAVRMRAGSLDFITGYYFTNYGASAEISVLRFDHTVTRFIERAQQEAPDAWARAVALNWQAGKKGELEADDESRITNNRFNRFYNQLFSLPDYDLQFLATMKWVLNWKLIEIFLQEVMGMEQERIDTYRRLGDFMTDYALKFENQPHSFYYAFSRARNYSGLISVIRSAAEKMLKSDVKTMPFTYDEFVMAFEHPSEKYHNWRLGRDLISIRMLERLHQEKNIDLTLIPEDDMNPTRQLEESETD